MICDVEFSKFSKKNLGFFLASVIWEIRDNGKERLPHIRHDILKLVHFTCLIRISSSPLGVF